MSSSYSSLGPSESDYGYYDENNYDNYAYDDVTPAKGVIPPGDTAAITLAAVIVPVIIIIIVVAIIIAILVELKHINDAVSGGVDGRASKGWFDSISNAINDIDSESILRRMFPGGFSSVVRSIEEAYVTYRGFDASRAKKLSAQKQKQKKVKAGKN